MCVQPALQTTHLKWYISEEAGIASGFFFFFFARSGYAGFNPGNFTLSGEKTGHYSPAGKESTCNTGDPGLIPGSGRSPEKEIGYPLQYSWVSLVAQMVKNPPAMQETWV